MGENNLNRLPYAAWLENALQELIKLPVRGICMYAVAEDGSVYSNYHEITMMDKLTIAGLIQQDAMMDNLEANGIIHSDESEQE